MNPWGGVRTTATETAAWAKDQTGMGLQLTEAGLAAKMNQARIMQMLFNQQMAGKQLGLKEKYFGLEEGMFGLAQKRFGLDEGRFGLAQRQFGVSQGEMGLREQAQNLGFDRARWQYETGRDKVKQQSKDLDWATALGLGTNLYSAYEGSRRSKLLAAEAEELRAHRKKQEAAWNAASGKK
jgi:uncharacterized small protein (DUF1192 family)